MPWEPRVNWIGSGIKREDIEEKLSDIGLKFHCFQYTFSHGKQYNPGHYLEEYEITGLIPVNWSFISPVFFRGRREVSEVIEKIKEILSDEGYSLREAIWRREGQSIEIIEHPRYTERNCLGTTSRGNLRILEVPPEIWSFEKLEILEEMMRNCECALCVRIRWVD